MKVINRFANTSFSYGESLSLNVGDIVVMGKRQYVFRGNDSNGEPILQEVASNNFSNVPKPPEPRLIKEDFTMRGV